jgi:hypothetical protein
VFSSRPVPSGRGRLRRSGPPRPGTDRPAGHGKADAGPDQPTPCSQSQFGRCCHLRGRGTAQVEAASWLSVVVRSGPFRTAVNGTFAARPVNTPADFSACGGVLGGPRPARQQPGSRLDRHPAVAFVVGAVVGRVRVPGAADVEGVAILPPGWTPGRRKVVAECVTALGRVADSLGDLLG